MFFPEAVRNLKGLGVVAIAALVTMSACSPPSRDSELEKRVADALNAESVVAMQRFDQVVVNVTGAPVASAEPEVQKRRARDMVSLISARYPESTMIMIGYVRDGTTPAQYAYTWTRREDEWVFVSQ